MGDTGSRFSTLHLLCAGAGHSVADRSPRPVCLPLFGKMNGAVTREGRALWFLNCSPGWSSLCRNGLVTVPCLARAAGGQKRELLDVPWLVWDAGARWGLDGSLSACSRGHPDPPPRCRRPRSASDCSVPMCVWGSRELVWNTAAYLGGRACL